MKKTLFIIVLVMYSLSVTGQGGLLRPTVLGWPPANWDTTEWNLVLGTNGQGKWVAPGNGSDSVYVFGADSLCFIVLGDTTCVELDSIYYTDTTVCFIELMDTTCLSWSSTSGNIYTIDGALTNSRTVTMNNKFLRFVQAGNLDGFQILPLSSQRMTAIQARYSGASTGVNAAMLELNNTALSGTERNAFVRYQNGTNIYSMGEDLSILGFTFSDSSNLKNPVWQYYNPGDSLVFRKDIKIDAGLQDSDGDYGASGEVLSSTGSATDWIALGGATDSIPISQLKPALSARNFDNENYTQEWKWNTLGAESGLKLSSNSTQAASGLQKLFEVDLSGTNATASQSTYAGYFSNTHAGSGFNYGVRSIVSGGGAGSIAVWGTASSASGGCRAIRGDVTSGSGSAGVLGTASASGGFGLDASASGGAIPLRVLNNSTSTNTVQPLAYLRRDVSGGSGANGNGGSLQFQTQTTVSQGIVSNEIESEWVDATHADRDSRMTITGVSNATTNDLIYLEGDKRTRFNGRAQFQKGANVASANDLSLGYDGNVFSITGTTQINAITTTDWQAGSEITLIFASTPIVKNNTAGGAGTAVMLLAGGADFSATANDVLKLIYDGTQWLEVSRSVN